VKMASGCTCIISGCSLVSDSNFSGTGNPGGQTVTERVLSPISFSILPYPLSLSFHPYFMRMFDPLSSTLYIYARARVYIYIYIYMCVCVCVHTHIQG
jgi:hypothetical protein